MWNKYTYEVHGCLYRTYWHLVHNCYTRMSSNFTYGDAILQLNSLTTVRQVQENAKQMRDVGQTPSYYFDRYKKFFSRAGMTMSKLDELSIIHIAGTKGKGTTSAMCESILRHHGYKTGFYTSPHLMSATERIRINGRPLDKNKFASYVQKLYNMWESTKTEDNPMPNYFIFLTAMAFNAFLDEKVDVAVVEVGIGGLFDVTNILRKVPVVGITTLGLDHTSILGDTIEKIAQQKAGIMKPGAIAYTTSQPPAALEVIRRTAKCVNCPVYVVPKYETYSFPEGHSSQLPVDLDVYYINAALAIQLAHAWMRTVANTNGNLLETPMHSKADLNGLASSEIEINDNERDEITREVPVKTLQGLQNCNWPGRFQVVRSEYAEFYLDGAHTRDSMEICGSWFKSNTSDRSLDKILIFSSTGDRDNEALLTPLKHINFQRVYFVVPLANKEVDMTNDNYSRVDQSDFIAKCKENVEIWKQLNGSSSVLVMECVSDALKDIKQSSSYSQVLITGTLYLVGASLSILNPIM